MRIGELADAVGVSTDTVRFYERSGWLPRASRRDNAYREYGPADVEHLRLIIDLRRLDLPLEDAARIAGWCHSGHCGDTTAELPRMIEERRLEIADRIAGLQALDARLAGLFGHLHARAGPSRSSTGHVARLRTLWSERLRTAARAVLPRRRLDTRSISGSWCVADDSTARPRVRGRWDNRHPNCPSTSIARISAPSGLPVPTPRDYRLGGPVRRGRPPGPGRAAPAAGGEARPLRWFAGE